MAKKKLVKKVSSRAVKTPTNKYLPTLVIILVSLLIVMVLVQMRNNRMEHMQNIMQQQVTPTQSYQLDTENDGVYTDDKYGFTFKYPKETFKYQPLATNYDNETGWFKQEWFPSMKSVDLYLYTETGKSYDNLYAYPEAKKLSVDQSVGRRNIDYLHRLKPLNNTIPNAIFYYRELDTSTELKSIVYIYSVSWEKEGNVITVNLGSSNKKLLESKYSIFIDVVNSIHLN